MKLSNATIGAIVGCIVAVAALTPAHAAVSADDGIDVSGMHVEHGVDLTGPVFIADEHGGLTSANIDESRHTAVANPRGARASGCNWYRMTIPVGGAWYTSVDGCSLIGINDSAAHIYGWEVDPNSHGNPCMQGRGYNKVGSTWTAQYVAIGCGSYGAKSVRIGNVITTAKVKGQSIGATGTSLVFY
ncbi:hypothetical protein [Leifsonia sp. Le1]|uniref:hypothetical protein n=1 Tax=Leifsonia sp. Le1 TaxID=3404918 RepID=UPI003EB9C7BA